MIWFRIVRGLFCLQKHQLTLRLWDLKNAGLQKLKKVLTDKREYGILIKVAEDSRCVSVS